MRRFCAAVLLLCLSFFFGLSCAQKESVAVQPPAAVAAVPMIAPLAVLQAGEFPLWFQFTVNGPTLIETIDDACFSAALVPWPLAPHVRFALAQGDDIVMAINGDGFLRFSPRAGEQTGLYRFSGGELWRQYTVGAFVMVGEMPEAKPMALLYRDDRFIDSDAPLPSPRLWTVDPYSGLKAHSLLSLDTFAPQDGWDIDALRRGSDGLWYFRAVKKTGQPELHMLRFGDVADEGEKVTLGAFQNAALPEPLAAAPALLAKTLGGLLNESGCGIAAVVSPEFQTVRTFATDREKPALFGFFSGKPDSAFLLAASPQGEAYYLETDNAIRRFSLPPLPEGFAYTGIALCGNTVIASWEEQDEYSIGAAGFMVVKL